ncbi:MAG: helix-turn-helix transcriptional regulator [Patescibacteria group bacterium]
MGNRVKKENNRKSCPAKVFRKYLEKVHGVTLINFSRIIEDKMKNPKFARMVELEKKKLEVSLAISDLRRKKKISQAELAKRIGVKQSAVGRIEAGEQNLTIDTLQKIASALNKELTVCFS